MQHALSFDLEDYHSPEQTITTTHLILDELKRFKTKATFFILGWIAEREPGIVRQIAERGHEIACHGYDHRLVYDLTPDAFRADLVRARRAIEDAAGVRPVGYRAPSYSITRRSVWALDVLADEGFEYDSSIFPTRHPRYGIPDFSRTPVFQTGIEFNKTMEDNRLAMSALIGSMYDYRDASGNVVDSSRAFDAAMEDAISLQKELRIAGLATSATYQELAQGMQVAFAPAKEAGIKMEQLVNFVQRFAQVMQVMTVPMNQMSEEVRSFLTGVMVPRQTRLESYWRGLGLTNEKNKELISTGSCTRRS